MTAMRSLALAAAAVTALTVPVATREQRKPATPPGPVTGNGTMYVSTYKGVIAVIDEATEKLLGEIPVSVGIPGDVTFSDDRSKIYVVDATFEKVEILDREKRTSLGTFTLSKDKVKTRIWNLQPDPHDQYVILLIKNYTLTSDHWEIGPATLVQYDLASKSVTRTIPWPKGEEREGAGVLFSPDGSLMYLLGDDILIYETKTFTEVDRWDLARPLEPGAGRVNFGLDPFSDVPGFFTGIFTMQDPAQGRRIMGLGRIDLAKKKIEYFHPLGPARSLGLTVTPDRRRAYGIFRDIGEYEFWSFDLENRRLLQRVQFAGRPRMGLRSSSSGQVLYIYVAGNTIDLYDTATFKLMRTITLDGDMTSFTLLSPRPAAAR
jgi:WD40 repeat protein